jgi:hypothetical protein
MKQTPTTYHQNYKNFYGRIIVRKNLVLPILLTVFSVGFVNLFSADDSTKYWKYGTIASAGVGVVGTIGCLYKISQMKKNRSALETGNLSEEDYQNLAEQIKSDKNWAIIFGLGGGAGWISTGICGYKWWQGSKEGSGGGDGEDDDPEKYKIPLPKGYKGKKIPRNEYTGDDMYWTGFVAYKQLSDNTGIEPNFKNIFTLLENDFLSESDDKKRKIFFDFLRFASRDFSFEESPLTIQYANDVEELMKDGNRDLANRNRMNIIKQGERALRCRKSLFSDDYCYNRFDQSMEYVSKAMDTYKENPDKVPFDTSAQFQKGSHKSKHSFIELVAYARSLSEDEKNPNYIPTKL